MSRLPRSLPLPRLGAARPEPLAGRTAVITGAASGIGRAVAQRLATHGCPVALMDHDEAGLADTAATISGAVITQHLDVRDKGAIQNFAARVQEWAPAPIGLVFNNAGVTALQSVADGSPEDDQWVMDINYGGVVNGVSAFLPILLKQGSGAIVNTSSVFGLVGFPNQSAYCASKFAVRGYTDALRQELRGTGVRAANVHPGGVKTNIVRNARFRSDHRGKNTELSQAALEFDAIARCSPERAAKIIHEGIDAGKARILIGTDAYVFDALGRVLPTHYYEVLERLERLLPTPKQKASTDA